MLIMAAVGRERRATISVDPRGVHRLRAHTQGDSTTMATTRFLYFFQSTTGTPSIVPVKTVSRWQAAASDAREAFDRMRDAQDELHTALADLDEIKGEQTEFEIGADLAECWWTGCVCSRSAALADLSEYEEAVSVAEHTALPIGFGRARHG
jgi:hypothetical protein